MKFELEKGTVMAILMWVFTTVLLGAIWCIRPSIFPSMALGFFIGSLYIIIMEELMDKGAKTHGRRN